MLKQFKPTKKQNPLVKGYRKKLRARGGTKAEKIASQELHRAGIQFERQACFKDKKTREIYIADFWLWDLNLILELDGSQHSREPQLTRDRARDKSLALSGILTLRLPNKSAPFVLVLLAAYRLGFKAT